VPDTTEFRSTLRRRAGWATIPLIAVLAAGVLAQPASAAGSATVSFTAAGGGTTADPEFATTLSVAGSGFQTIVGGFGGVYALFGWVDPAGGWKPSEGGLVGSGYRYVPDQESKDNGGFQRFISFPGSETEGAANAIMTPEGGWSVDMVVPGSTFESRDRDGEISEVDCLTVQCGIITIGAHGVKNPNNETFTPITFAVPATGAAAETPAGEAAAPVAGAARVGYTTTTAIAGNALSFTGQGFSAGEQVVAVLDDGVAAIGPLTAGQAGEVAGVLELPDTLRAGTHLLTLTGAASASVAEAEVTVTVDPDRAVAPVVEEAPPAWPYLLLGLGVLLAFALLLTSVITALVRARRRRRERRAAASADLAPQQPALQQAAPQQLAMQQSSDAQPATDVLETPVGARFEVAR